MKQGKYMMKPAAFLLDFGVLLMVLIQVNCKCSMKKVNIFILNLGNLVKNSKHISLWYVQKWSKEKQKTTNKACNFM